MTITTEAIRLFVAIVSEEVGEVPDGVGGVPEGVDTGDAFGADIGSFGTGGLEGGLDVVETVDDTDIEALGAIDVF